VITSLLVSEYEPLTNIFHVCKRFSILLTRKISKAYKRSRTYLIRKKNNLTLLQVEKGIKISQYVKYVSAFLTIIAAVLTFKYSDDEVFFKTTGSVSVVSGVTALTSEIIKERFLEPRLKRLEALPVSVSDSRLRQIFARQSVSSSRTAESRGY